MTWSLYFDAVASSPRRERSAVDSSNDAKELSWRVALSGEVELREGRLVLATRSEP
jgi:hypothetical protein